MIKVKSYKGHLLKQLQDPGEAAEYLNAALQEDDHHAFLLALGDLANAQESSCTSREKQRYRSS